MEPQGRKAPASQSGILSQSRAFPDSHGEPASPVRELSSLGWSEEGGIKDEMNPENCLLAALVRCTVHLGTVSL